MQTSCTYLRVGASFLSRSKVQAQAGKEQLATNRRTGTRTFSSKEAANSQELAATDPAAQPGSTYLTRKGGHRPRTGRAVIGCLWYCFKGDSSVIG